jgi:DSF synthase
VSLDLPHLPFGLDTRGILATFEERPDELRYLLLGSRTPGVFNLGGDLDHFAARMRVRDRQALVAYGESCVRILHRNIECLGLPIVTIGLAQGDAPGGGFESLLSFNIIIAEHGAKFGFPENIFGLFPGMGAYSLVARRVGAAFAEEMMLGGRIYTAEVMKDVGLVHILAEPGQGLLRHANTSSAASADTSVTARSIRSDVRSIRFR